MAEDGLVFAMLHRGSDVFGPAADPRWSFESDPIRAAIAAVEHRPIDADVLAERAAIIRETLAIAVAPPHVHEWEDAYVLERLGHPELGDARVWWCPSCDATREYTDRP